MTLGISALSFIVLLFVCAVLTFTYGSVEGDEFDPHQFQRRSYSYYEFPILRMQLSAISRFPTTGSVEQYITAQKFVVPSAGQKSSWDLVYENKVDPGSHECDARILCAYFDAYDDSGTYVWHDWSQNNQPLAQVLWPAVAKVARQDLYVFVPDLMELAKSSRDPATLKTDIDNLLARNYRRLADARSKLGNHTSAVELFTESLVHEADNVEALLGRAAAYDALGEKEKSQADRAEAERLARESEQRGT